jgi:hypothetical protein
MYREKLGVERSGADKKAKVVCDHGDRGDYVGIEERDSAWFGAWQAGQGEVSVWIGTKDGVESKLMP